MIFSFKAVQLENLILSFNLPCSKKKTPSLFFPIITWHLTRNRFASWNAAVNISYIFSGQCVRDTVTLPRLPSRLKRTCICNSKLFIFVPIYIWAKRLTMCLHKKLTTTPCKGLAHICMTLKSYLSLFQISLTFFLHKWDSTTLD